MTTGINPELFRAAGHFVSMQVANRPAGSMPLPPDRFIALFEEAYGNFARCAESISSKQSAASHAVWMKLGE